eukprot:gene22392-biopygen10251
MPVGLVPFWGSSSPKSHQQPDPPRGWVGTLRSFPIGNDSLARNLPSPGALVERPDYHFKDLPGPRRRVGAYPKGTATHLRLCSFTNDRIRTIPFGTGSPVRKLPSPGALVEMPGHLSKDAPGPRRPDFLARLPARKSAPRAARPPHPPRGPGARRGRMGPEVGPAFQRRSRDTPSSNIGVRLAETVSRHVDSKEMHALWHFGR